MSGKLATFGLILAIMVGTQNQVTATVNNARSSVPLGWECWADLQCQMADPNSACMNINWVTGWGQCGCIEDYEENSDGVCDTGLSTGAIVGIAVGSVVGFIIILLIIGCIIYKCAGRKGHSIKWDVPAGETPVPVASRPHENAAPEHKVNTK